MQLLAEVTVLVLLITITFTPNTIGQHFVYRFIMKTSSTLRENTAFVVIAVLIGLLVQQSSAEEVISFSCDATNCLDCLNLGCGWFPAGGEADKPGECVTTCSVIADAACYAEEYFVGQSPQSICNLVNSDANDSNTCRAVSDCDQCINTIKSDGVSKCVWYKITNNCGSGTCNFLGCGSSTCPNTGEVVTNPASSPTAVIIATTKPTRGPISSVDIANSTRSPTPIITGSPTIIVIDPLENSTSVCDRLSASSCDTCIDSGCAWIGSCIESCSKIANVSCYDNMTFPNITNGTDICDMAEPNANDTALCLEQETCSDCISAILSDSNQSCSWYSVENDPSASRCCLSCDAPGTPTTTCSSTASNDTNSDVPSDFPSDSPSESSACNAIAASCSICLNSGCAWVAGNKCLESCNVTSNPTCIDFTTFPNLTNVSEICSTAELSIDDSTLCLSQSTCTDCVSVQLSIPDRPCIWYAAGANASFGSTCCLGCDVPGVPTTTCNDTLFDPIRKSPTQSPAPFDRNSNTSSICEESSLTCNQCLSAGCAYLGNQNCLESCDIIADTACYDSTTFPNITNITEICIKAEQNEMDIQLCSEQSTCTACTSVSLSDNDKSCTWYSVQSDPSRSTCCLVCDVPGIPVTTCDDITNSLETTSSSSTINTNTIIFFYQSITTMTILVATVVFYL
jgi:hypothetical protein